MDLHGAVSRESDTVVVKIGGSLLTDPSEPESFRPSYAEAAAEALTAVEEPIVIVHGTGSFGKPPAARYGFENGFLGPNRAPAFAEMERRLDRLRGRFLTVLSEADLPVLRLTPSALFVTEDGRIVEARVEPVRRLLGRNVIPVLSGGFVPDRRRGFAVCSSDDQAAHLARRLEANRLLYATRTAGVQDRTGSSHPTIDRLHLDEARIREVTERSREDVSGGMRGKLLAARPAVEAGIPTWVLDGRDPGRIRALATGESVKATRLLAAQAGDPG